MCTCSARDVSPSSASVAAARCSHRATAAFDASTSAAAEEMASRTSARRRRGSSPAPGHAPPDPRSRRSSRVHSTRATAAATQRERCSAEETAAEAAIERERARDAAAAARVAANISEEGGLETASSADSRRARSRASRKVGSATFRANVSAASFASLASVAATSSVFPPTSASPSSTASSKRLPATFVAAAASARVARRHADANAVVAAR